MIQMRMLFIAQKISIQKKYVLFTFFRCPAFGKNNSKLSLSSRVRRWNSGCFLLWSHIGRLYYEDLESGFKLANKLTSYDINLTSYSVMRVNLAAQVLSATVGKVLNSFNPEEAEGTGQFCIIMDNFFYCLNVQNTKEHIIKRKPF